jgi:hypothetical protein
VMPLFVSVYQLLRSDQSCLSSPSFTSTRPVPPLLSLLGRPAPQISTHSAADPSSLSPHSFFWRLRISALSRRPSRCMKRGYLVKLSRYTYASLPTARTDASMHPYALPPNSSFPCTDPPRRTQGLHRRFTRSPRQPTAQTPEAFLLRIESLRGPLNVLRTHSILPISSFARATPNRRYSF